MQRVHLGTGRAHLAVPCRRRGQREETQAPVGPASRWVRGWIRGLQAQDAAIGTTAAQFSRSHGIEDEPVNGSVWASAV
eukprot:3651899-Prymnesium_polylepis.1